jgi:hypothetical protein
MRLSSFKSLIPALLQIPVTLFVVNFLTFDDDIEHQKDKEARTFLIRTSKGIKHSAQAHAQQSCPIFSPAVSCGIMSETMSIGRRMCSTARLGASIVCAREG